MLSLMIPCQLAYVWFDSLTSLPRTGLTCLGLFSSGGQTARRNLLPYLTHSKFDSTFLVQIQFARSPVYVLLAFRSLPDNPAGGLGAIQSVRRYVHDWHEFQKFDSSVHGVGMRLFGHKVCSKLSVWQFVFFALLLAGFTSTVHGQTAPYVLPYTMTTYVGAHAPYTTSAAACGTGHALDGSGDGCPASLFSVGTDPHDVRVDGLGNLFFLDDTAGTVIHKVNPFTGLTTIYYGSTVNAKACAAGGTVDKTGDNCTATDNAANSTATLYTYTGKTMRGLGVGLDGDLAIAGYNDLEIHKIAASNLFMSLQGGSYTTSGALNGAVGTSTFNQARGVSIDASGNIYVADTGNNILRKIVNGVSSNVSASNSSKTLNTANGPISSALLAAPEDVQIDPYGNIIVADAGNNVIRAVYEGSGPFFGISSPTVGWIYVIAGSGTAPATGTYTYSTNGTAPVVASNSVAIGVRKIGINAQGDVFIADSSWNVVWMVDHATGDMRLIAGEYGAAATTGTNGSNVCAAHTNIVGDGCPGPQSTLDVSSDMGASANAFGDLYVTDAEGAGSSISRIRKVVSGLNFPATAINSSTTQTIFLHFAASDTQAASAPFTISGNGTDFQLGTVSCSATPNLDQTTDCLVPVTFTPSVAGLETATLTATSTKGGVGTFVLSGTGTMAAIAYDPGNAILLSSAVNNAQGIALDGAGNAYVADTGNNRVLFYQAGSSTPTVFAGGGSASCTGSTDTFGDGCAAKAAALNAPKAVAVDITGAVYIADTGNNIIRKVTPGTGIISLYGGNGTGCSAKSDSLGDNCLATQATFSSPAGLVADNVGNLYVSDTGNNVIRIISSTGYVSPLAGGATTLCTGKTDAFGDGCPASQTTFTSPAGLAFDATGSNIFVADAGDNIIRKIFLSTTIGTNGTGTSGFPLPTSIQVNPVTLVAGNGGNGDSVDANSLAINSQLSAPTGVAVDAAGNTYIADTGNNSIRLVNEATGIISSIAGITSPTGGKGTLPGSATIAQLTSPGALAVYPNGTIYVVDSGNNRILTDTRNAISYNFGLVNVNSVSPYAFFTALNIGVSSVTEPNPLFTQSTPNTQFTLTGVANSNNSIGACTAAAALASGGICYLEAQFSPTASASETSTFNQSFVTGATPLVPGTPSITLIGVGAVLTPTTSVVTQSANSQYGAPVTFTATVSATCNIYAPSCAPTGTVTFTIDNVAQAPIPMTANAAVTAATASISISGLAVGNHSVSCNYSGDDFYASGSCTAITAVVAQASTTSLLSLTNNNQTQYACQSSFASSYPPAALTCVETALTGTVVSNTTGVPTGTVTFFAHQGSTNASGATATITGYTATVKTGSSSYNFVFNATNAFNVGGTVYFTGLTNATFLNGQGLTITAATATTFTVLVTSIPSGFALSGTETGSAIPGIASTQLNANAVGSSTLQYTEGNDGNLVAGSDTTLPPGTYSVNCIYSGATNFASSTCASVTYTVTSPAAAFSLIPYGCIPSSLYQQGTQVASLASTCTGYNTHASMTNPPTVSVAQGSTTDATIFILPSTTMSGTLTFSCSGLPSYATCTFSPTSITLTPGAAFPTPVYTDVTFWNDVSGSAAELHAPSIGASHRDVALASIIGWPVTLLGLTGIFTLRRKRNRLRMLSLFAAILVVAGSAVTLSGCNGPGAYVAVLTPAGTYPITVSATNGAVTKSVVVNYTVTAPGIPGLE